MENKSLLVISGLILAAFIVSRNKKSKCSMCKEDEEKSKSVQIDSEAAKVLLEELRRQDEIEQREDAIRNQFNKDLEKLIRMNPSLKFTLTKEKIEELYVKYRNWVENEYKKQLVPVTKITDPIQNPTIVEDRQRIEDRPPLDEKKKINIEMNSEINEPSSLAKDLQEKSHLTNTDLGMYQSPLSNDLKEYDIIPNKRKNLR